jgi:PAS domain S-box-containing protein
MNTFLEINQDYLLLLSGLAFALLGFIARAFARLDEQPAWWLLSWFGFTRSLHAWFAMLCLVDFRISEFLAATEPLLLGVSCVFLIEFARCHTAARHHGRPGRWIHLPLLAGAGAVSFLSTSDALTWVYLLLNPIGGLWSAFVIWTLHHSSPNPGERWRWKLAAITMAIGTAGLTACAAFAGNEERSGNLAGLLFVLGSTLLVCLIVATLGWCYSRRAQSNLPAERVSAWRRRRSLWIALAAVVIVMGWVAAQTVGHKRDQAMRRDVLARTQLVAAAVPADLVRTLEWSGRDLKKTSYQTLKALMISLVNANPDIRFVLLSGVRDSQCFFLVDSEDPKSEDYSPPGQLYEEAEAGYLSALTTRQPFVLGPIRDRWGVWVSGSVPVLELGNGRYVSADIDIAATDWNAAIVRERLPVAVIVLLILSLLLLSFHAQERIRDQMDRLALSEQRNTTLVEGSPDCVQMLALDGRCITVNHRGLVALGCPAAAVIGRTFAELWPLPVRPLVVDAVHNTAVGKATHFEADYLRPDGRVITWRVTMNPIRNNAGQVISSVCICTDITQSKNHERTLLAAKEAAEAADRAKSEFLSVMSHEIRTPLGGVIGMLDILQHHPQSAEQRRYIEMAHGSAGSLLEILDDILDAAKVESGRLNLETIAFRPREEFVRVLDAMKLRADSKDLNLTWTFDPALPAALLGDPVRLRQVLANLLSNAIKFTAQGGITVNIDRAAEIGEKISLQLKVRDTGIGIPPEARNKLFEKFSQADASTTRRYGGTGLGLSIIKGLVEQMGGTVSVQSTPGEGSTFIIQAPLAIASESQITELPSTTEKKPALLRHSTSLRLLYAEDDAVHREIAANQARDMGHTLVFAHNGAEALEKLRDGEYDAVLMDNRMPVLDGFQTTRAIRAGTGGVRRPQIPIIAVTANASEKYREECLAAGMNDFLAKPLNRSAFHRALSHILDTAGSPTTVPAGLTEAELHALLDDDAASPRSTSGPPNPRLVSLYFQETPKRFSEMHSALEKKDAASFARAAHSLKSTSAYAHSPELCELGERLEKLADDRQFSALPELLARAHALFKQLNERAPHQSKVTSPIAS